MNRMKNRRRRRTGCIKHYPASKKSVDDAITSNEDRPELGGNRCIISGLTLNFALLGHFLQPEPLRSEDHTPELQSRGHLVCRLPLKKKKQSYMDRCTTYCHSDI